MQPTVAISSDFLDAFAKLPRKEQQKTSSFLTKLRNDPTAPGINYEKIESSADAKIYSVRIDDAYRGIVVREQDTGVYLLLWVDHHDEAYDWARRKRCAVNPKTGTLQVYDVKDEEGNVVRKQGGIDFGTVYGPDYHSDTSYLYDHLHYVWAAYPKYEQNEDGSFVHSEYHEGTPSGITNVPYVEAWRRAVAESEHGKVLEVR